MKTGRCNANFSGKKPKTTHISILIFLDVSWLIKQIMKCRNVNEIAETQIMRDPKKFSKAIIFWG